MNLNKMKLTIVLFYCFLSCQVAMAITADPTRLMCVHITDIVPKNGVMTPGTGHSNLKDPEGRDILTASEMLEINANLPWRRYTLHWSLGGPVESHEHSQGQMDWTSRNFAIIEPLSELVPQSLGGHAQDWISVGPHRLSSKAIILAPIGKESEIPVALQGQMRTYDKQAMNIHRAVLDYLKDHDLPVFEYDFATSPFINVTVKNIESFIGKVAALKSDQVMSKHIKNAYEAIKRMGLKDYTNNFKYGFQMTKTPVMTLIDKEALPKQIITIGSEATTCIDYFKPILEANPKLKWCFHGDFAFEQIDVVLRNMFVHANFFLAAEKLAESKSDVSLQLYNQASSGDTMQSHQLQQLIEKLKLLLDQAKEQMPQASAEAGNHWIMSIKIWIKYLAEHYIKLKTEGKPFYTQRPEAIRDHLTNVAATAKKNCIDKIIALYQ